MSAALDRECAACGAVIGELCRGRRGPRKAFHRARGRREATWRKSVVGRTFEGTDEKIGRLITGAAQAEAVRFEEDFYWRAELCESPIEKLLLAALYAEQHGNEFAVEFRGNSTAPPRHVQDETAYIYQQVQVATYRVDFLIYDATIPVEISEPRWMVVECDGHDFHERTKEQARRDKQRDRFFQSRGFKVLRFTGSEIFADPQKCAEEILGEMARDDDWRNRVR